jgi:hypothetical protein
MKRIRIRGLKIQRFGPKVPSKTKKKKVKIEIKDSFWN